MYPYLLTTDGKRKTFLQIVIEKIIGKICKKNKFILWVQRSYLIQKELNQIVNHKVVQWDYAENGWNCAVKPKSTNR